jgi:hypothetical protein
MSIAQQLHEALSEENGAKVVLSDEDLVKLAQRVSDADPKKRFTAMAIRRLVASDHGAEWVDISASGGATLDKRVRELAQGKGPFIPDRAGTFRLAKRGTGSGLEFVKQGPDEYEVLLNGEYVGRLRQDYVETGLYRSREKQWEAEMDDDRFVGKNAPPAFKSLADAKKWVSANVAP